MKHTKNSKKFFFAIEHTKTGFFSITLIKCIGKDQLENIKLPFCYGWPNRNLPSCDNKHFPFGVINLNTPDMISCLVTNTDINI